MDLLYELVGLPQPEWTDEISVALDAVDPSDFQVSYLIFMHCYNFWDCSYLGDILDDRNNVRTKYGCLIHILS